MTGLHGKVFSRAYAAPLFSSYATYSKLHFWQYGGVYKLIKNRVDTGYTSTGIRDGIKSVSYFCC